MLENGSSDEMHGRSVMVANGKMTNRVLIIRLGICSNQSLCDWLPSLLLCFASLSSHSKDDYANYPARTERCS
jgi:hypothetical protein